MQFFSRLAVCEPFWPRDHAHQAHQRSARLQSSHRRTPSCSLSSCFFDAQGLCASLRSHPVEPHTDVREDTCFRDCSLGCPWLPQEACEQNTLTRHIFSLIHYTHFNVTPDIGSRVLRTSFHHIHASCALCVVWILFETPRCTLHRLSHLPPHSPDLHLQLPCGLVRREIPCVLSRMRSLTDTSVDTALLTGYEPNVIDNFHISETTEFFIQESSSDSRPLNSHDLDIDDYTIGRAPSSPLFTQEREEPAGRRQVYHSPEESLLSSQLLSVCHVRTGRPVSDQFDSLIPNVRENPCRESENEQVRILRERQKRADSR